MPADVCLQHHAFCRNCGDEGAGHGPFSGNCKFHRNELNIERIKKMAKDAWPAKKIAAVFREYNARKAVEDAIAGRGNKSGLRGGTAAAEQLRALGATDMGTGVGAALSQAPAQSSIIELEEGDHEVDGEEPEPDYLDDMYAD